MGFCHSCGIQKEINNTARIYCEAEKQAENDRRDGKEKRITHQYYSTYNLVRLSARFTAPAVAILHTVLSLPVMTDSKNSSVSEWGHTVCRWINEIQFCILMPLLYYLNSRLFIQIPPTQDILLVCFTALLLNGILQNGFRSTKYAFWSSEVEWFLQDVVRSAMWIKTLFKDHGCLSFTSLQMVCW